MGNTAQKVENLGVRVLNKQLDTYNDRLNIEYIDNVKI